MITINDLLISFGESAEVELEAQGLADWSIGTAGENIKDVFNQLPNEDLKDLITDITEGLQLHIKVDITDALLKELEDILKTRRVIQLEEEDEEDEDQVP